MLKKKKILTLLLFSAITYAESAHIEVDISEQRLYLIENNQIKASYPISSSKYGEGSIENSFKTPLGEHSIKEMIGEEAKMNTIFTSRINTKRLATIIDQFEDTDNDYVTSRIMWLGGEEDGFNKGGNVDSFRRYIYIHGTHEEGLIGIKASHGCIRMFNYDVVELFNLVGIGTKVLIRV
jgi:lipoprotein-anchoring transpeptidase ErfK/SrfK